jgi:heme A synthase
MFFALLVAGTICTIWGVWLFIARYQAMKKTALEAESAREQKGDAGSPQAAASTPAQPRQPLISPWFRSALKVTAYLALIQGVIGGILFFTGHAPPDQLHYVYGALVVFAIPAAFIYLTGKPEHIRRDMLFLIIAAIVVAAAAVRAAMTGGFQF